MLVSIDANLPWIASSSHFPHLPVLAVGELVHFGLSKKQRVWEGKALHPGKAMCPQQVEFAHHY
jgi:hypothetical protein